MYEIDSSQFTSKPDTKKEFIQYIKDCGVAETLQKAMVLLYRMPVKPTNLVEYFWHYFENGATGLTKISLLKAELCYKRGELQKRAKKVKELENRIDKLRNSMGITDEDFNERFMPEEAKERNRLSILERYFKDMEKGLQTTLDEVVEEVQREQEIMSALSQSQQAPEEEDGSEGSEEIQEENPEDFPIISLEINADPDIIEDIKELDPWGIVLRHPKEISPPHSFNEKHGWNKMRDGHLHPLNAKPDAALPMDMEDANEEEHEHDEDVATLAEVFHQTLIEMNTQEQDPEAAKLHEQLLTVKNAGEIKMSDLIGWGSHQEGEPKIVPNSINASTLFLQPCAESEMESLGPKGNEPRKVKKKSEEISDAFLFDDDDDLEHIYKMMEASHFSFDYEFAQHTRAPTTNQQQEEETCQPICTDSDVALICPKRPKECPCGEDKCECTPPVSTSASDVNYLTGKMVNWTHEFEEYPCPTMGEFMNIEYIEGIPVKQPKRPSNCDVSQLKSKPPKCPIVRIDPSCHCILTGVYSTNELLGEDEIRKISVDLPTTSSALNRQSKDEKDELMESLLDSTLENELDQVFKQKRKSSQKKSVDESSKLPLDYFDDELNDFSYPNDVFGIDLVREIRRDILGVTSSQASATTTNVQAATGNKIRKSNPKSRAQSQI